MVRKSLPIYCSISAKRVATLSSFFMIFTMSIICFSVKSHKDLIAIFMRGTSIFSLLLENGKENLVAGTAAIAFSRYFFTFFQD